MGEYSNILIQQGKTTSEKLAEFTAAIGWRDELATYRIVQDEYEMRAAAAASSGFGTTINQTVNITTDKIVDALEAQRGIERANRDLVRSGI